MTASPVSSANYRPDIDGLRALAVLSVVGFHAFPGMFKGGFIGVDIFFVISGYLISQIIFGQFEAGRFSYKEFYSRRIRRIFPALVTVMAASLVAGSFLLIADDYVHLGWHTIAGSFSAANIVLWHEAGYFDVAANTKPFLHLWSLGVEEQFYIFWPIFLGLMWARKRNFLTVTVCVAALSFAYSIYAIHHDPIEAFFSPVTRLWELMLGGILAYMTLHHHPFLRSRQTEKSLFGLLLIVLGLLLIRENHHFPGWWALLPGVGAFLIIAAGPGAWINKYILSHKIPVFIGLISYPLYLWHWPILVFQRMADPDIINVSDVTMVRINKLLALLASFILAYLTMRFIERPLRRSRNPRVVYALIAAAICVSCVAGLIILQKGFPTRSANQGSAIADLVYKIDKDKYFPCPDALKGFDKPLDYCLQSKNTAPDFAIIGDSHAEDKFYGLAEKGGATSWILLGHNSCPPVYGLSITGIVADCEKRSETIIDWLVSQPSVKTVLLSHYSGYFLTLDYAADHRLNKNAAPLLTFTSNGKEARGVEGKKAALAQGLGNTIRRLEKAGKNVILLVDIPELPFFPKDCLRHSDQSVCHLTRAEMDARQKAYRSMIATVQKQHPHLKVFDPTELLCTEKNCIFQTDQMSIYRDSHHLSLRGGELYAQKFYNWYDSAYKKAPENKSAALK